MSPPAKVHFPSFALQISGELYTPADGAPDRHGAAVVVSHPMTGVKEQTSADYARALAKGGFYALTFDAGYQGESTGQPRGLEDPHQRVEDIKAAVTHLATAVRGVDAARIGVLGICASGGYASYAVQSDGRVRALATVSAACVGRMTRAGGVAADKAESADAVAGVLAAAGQWRNDRARDAVREGEPAPVMFDVDPAAAAANPDPFFRDAAAYYGTSRGRHERSDQRVPPVSYDLMVSYDSFAFQRLIAPRPLLMIAGSKAQTLHYSRTAVESAREPKEFMVVEGKNHFDLYDDLTETGPKLVEFFGKALA